MGERLAEYPPTHLFDSDPDATWPSVYCKCGYDIDVHADKGYQFGSSEADRG